MARIPSAGRSAAALSLGLLFLAGCGGPAPVAVSGKISIPAKPKLAETDTVTLVFEPDEGEGGKAQSQNATASPKDLTFKASITPGKYKIAVNVQVYPGAGGPKEDRERPKELAQYYSQFSAKSSPLRCEITSDPNQTINIDLEKKTVGK